MKANTPGHFEGGEDRQGLNHEYRDTGCKYAPSCLNCPFPECLEDLRDEKRITGQALMAQYRHKEMLNLFYSGKSLKEISLLFDVATRTVQRAIKQHHQNNAGLASKSL